MKKSFIPLLFFCLIAIQSSFAQSKSNALEVSNNFFQTISKSDTKGFYEAGELNNIIDSRNTVFRQYKQHPIYGNAAKSLKYVRSVPMVWDFSTLELAKSSREATHMVVIFSVTQREEIAVRAITDILNAKVWNSIFGMETGFGLTKRDVFVENPSSFIWGGDGPAQKMLDALIGEDANVENFVTLILKKTPNGFNIGMPPTLKR
ncbi:MAG: hypothetical protein AAFV80_02280 [Bacteroidota bacterium]